MDWDKLRIFHAVAEAGSFTHAGRALNLSQSAVSRQVSALEETLHVPLFHRHARGLILTEQGELLHHTAQEVFAKLSMTEAILADSKERPKGPLVVTATVGFSTLWLTPHISEFLDLYPEISMTLICEDRELDLSMREADVAIRMRLPTQPDLVQRHLLRVHLHAYASADYIKEWGMPMTTDDLDDHRLIVYSDGPLARVTNPGWLLKRSPDNQNKSKNPDNRRPVFKVNNTLGMLRAVESGIGIAALPDYIIKPDSKAVRVLPNTDGPSIETYFVYPEELRNSKRIGVFRDFLLQKVKQTKF
jgi:DNA-binding transcriptional LysR family regulator